MKECCVCYKKDGYVCKTSCNHHVCCSCLYSLKKKICPLCRKNICKELNIKNNTNYTKKQDNLYDFEPIDLDDPMLEEEFWGSVDVNYEEWFKIWEEMIDNNINIFNE